MNIRPLADRILVKRDAPEAKTKGGLHIPGNAQEKTPQATVIAIGNGKVLDDGSVQQLDVQVGDQVIFSTHAGIEVKLEGEDVLVLRADDVIGVLEG